MADKKELSLDQLEKVSGGMSTLNYGKNDPHFAGFTGYVDMYHLTIGEKYYFVTSGNKWFYGKVIDTTEDYYGGKIRSERHQDVEVVDGGTYTKYPIGHVFYNLIGDEFANYTTKL